MKALTFDIRTIEPVLVARPGAGEENSATSNTFITGSVLRGLLIDRYLQNHSVSDAADDPACRRLFFDGTVVYLNAYPTNRLGQRTLPKPLSWLVARDDQATPGATVYNFAVTPREDVGNLVLLPGAFCWRTGSQLEVVEPCAYVSVHNASEDRNVKRKGKSFVYRYEAIAPGQLFSTAILSDNQNDLQTLRTLLEIEPTRIGGSRSAGYGLVRFENIHLVENWREYDSDGDCDEDIVVLTLLSDTILRHPDSGQFITNLDVVLGWTRVRAFCRTCIAGGFNRKWGLPSMQAPALRAGSTFVYRASDIDLKRLEVLVQEGIGERRLDGFGRIAVNWDTQAELRLRRLPSAAKFDQVQLSEGSVLLASQMAERRLRAVLDRKLLEALNRLTISNLASIKNTQLSRLRLVVLRAWREGNPRLLIDHLARLTKDARVQFERVRVGGQRFMTWLRDGIDKDTLWRDYLEPQGWEVPSVAGVKASPNDTIRVEYTMRLLDALLQRTIKEKQSGGGAA